jgi:hypothetical protein
MARKFGLGRRTLGRRIAERSNSKVAQSLGCFVRTPARGCVHRALLRIGAKPIRAFG